MARFLLPNRRQKLLVTEYDLATVAPEGSVVRVINDLVDSLDTSDIENGYRVDTDGGRPAYHPKTLLKVALLALHGCRFSLRKMEQDMRDNLAYKWLTGDAVIDATTMGHFLSRFADEIADLFSQVVRVCQEQGLIEFDLLAIDSVKLRASASYKQSKTIEGIEKEEDKLAARLREILEKANDAQSAEVEEVAGLTRRRERVAAAKAKLQERIAEKSRGVSEAEREALVKKEKVNITDPAASIMKQANGEKNPSYSITTTADTAHDIVTHFQVNAGDNDPAALGPAIEGSRETTGERHEEIVADAGFASMENLEELHDDGQKALVPDRRMDIEAHGEVGEYDRSKFVYTERLDSYRCPQGALLKKGGFVEMNGRRYDRYENPEACACCSVRDRCTKDRFRKIFRDQHEDLREAMRAKLCRAVARKRYTLRAHTAESPFGNIKVNLKFRAVMRRGYEKVRMEAALLFILHNAMRMARANT